nr:hypothetical protein [Chloroflexota bacterium]
MVESKHKPYDTSLKSLLQEQVADMLPYLLPGSVFEQELNVEVIRPTMLTDRVYRVRYRGQQHILHLELETGSLVEMPARLLFYHAGIFERYALPVISMVIYPFQVSMAESPLRETSGQQEILVFHFQTLPLWKLDARQFLDQHAISMYT